MIRKNKNLLIITSVIILLPIIAGVLLWNNLPDMMVTHWDANNEPDGYMSKAMVVFGMPLIMLAIHWACVLATASDKKNANASPKIITLVLWIAPLMSVLVAAVVFAHAFGTFVNAGFWAMLIVGAMFTVIGNYLPKCKQSYTIGIKLPWTLNDPENWNKTHRLAGVVWTVGGVLIILTAFMENPFVSMPVVIVMVLIPVIYSYVYYLKHKDD